MGNLVTLSKLEKIILFIKMSQDNENEIRKLVVKCQNLIKKQKMKENED